MIYICIPAHNEEATIGVLLWKIRKVLADFGRDYRIHVLDDASTDRTSEVVERYRSVLPLTCTRSEVRLGYSGAMDRLIRAAVAEAPYPKRDAVVTLQGDFTEDPADIVPLIKILEGGADVVAGVETDGATPGPRSLRITRWAAGWVLRGTLKSAPISDPLTGFRAYRVVVLKKALRASNETPLLDEPGWAGNLQLLGAVAPHARRIAETPLDSRPDLRVRESRFKSVPTLQTLLRVRGSVDWAPLEKEA